MCPDPATHGKVLLIDRQSEWLTYLRCISCKEIVAWWEADRSKMKTYSDENAAQYV